MASMAQRAPQQAAPNPIPRRRRRRQSRRGHSSLNDLARLIVDGKPVVVITGAGLSVASGVRPFRGKEGLWSNIVWTKATRQSFRKDPLKWYNEFWLPHFGSVEKKHAPSLGHFAIEEICRLSQNVKVITQNIDGLHGASSENLIEAHGRVGLYKCLPDEDSDTDSDSDEDHDRPVHLGHRRKSRGLQRAFSMQSDNTKESDSSVETTRSAPCQYEWMESIPANKLEPPSVRHVLGGPSPLSLHNETRKRKNPFITLQEPPRCPSCGKPCPPQALLFDEGYHSHQHYQFEKMEDWIASCKAIVFVGTSFAVTVTDVALEHARDEGIPVFNFNTRDALESTVRLNVENILGPSDETLPRLLRACRDLHAEQSNEDTISDAAESS